MTYRCIKKDCPATYTGSVDALVTAGWAIFVHPGGRKIFLCPKHLAAEKTKGLN